VRRFKEKLAEFANHKLFFLESQSVKIQGFHKRPVNIGRNWGFLEKGGFQKKDVKRTRRYNLATTV
jgi:hypothetical protein